MEQLRKYSIILIAFCSSFLANAQCVLEQDITICSMETIDFDADGTFDGIINLFDEYNSASGAGIAKTGTWSISPEFNVALDTSTGNVSLWALQNSTTSDNRDDYIFELRNSDCGTSEVVTVRLVLGPYSGTALPAFGVNDVNVEVCEPFFDLYETLVSNSEVPPPHLNGVWIYNGNSPSFKGIVLGSLFEAEIPYQVGLPLVDQEVFEFTYTVLSEATCQPIQETIVRVSMVRQVDSGTSEITEICEKDLLEGLYDTDINLKDDLFLVDEDEEGIWLPGLDPTGEIENEQDSLVNLRRIYDDLVRDNLRFGCETYTFNYSVAQRSGVCFDAITPISFTFFEQLRPFKQKEAPPQICGNEESSLDLFDLLEFTNEDGVDFIYDDSCFVDWRLVSGASSLNLNSDFTEFRCDGNSTYLGRINAFCEEPGEYVFEFGVSPRVNCSNDSCSPFALEGEAGYCEHPCEGLTTLVTIIILPFEYAGENTVEIELCETQESVDLISLLNVKSGEKISDIGVWRNDSGAVMQNDFTFPASDVRQDFSFTYTTTHPTSNCIDTATLDFSIIKEIQGDAGVGGETLICSNDLNVNLFDLLTGTPNDTGIWTGPFGYVSSDHIGRFFFNDTNIPRLNEGVYTYSVGSDDGCMSSDQSEITIVLVDPIDIGDDINVSFCKLDGRVNLFTLLDVATTRTGQFVDLQDTKVLADDGTLEFSTLERGIYNFQYRVPNAAPCEISTLNVEVSLFAFPVPVVTETVFCILDAKRLEDIPVKVRNDEGEEVDLLNFNWYPTFESTEKIVDNPRLFDGDVFYIANGGESVNGEECESERVAVPVRILNIGESFSDQQTVICPIDFQDGVSPDGNGQNDTFELVNEDGVVSEGKKFNVPEAFPDFNLEIYNRYGTIVYKGTIDTPEFDGQSNVSLSIGDELPSGVYFYIFNPNFKNNFPIQGSFYLSK